MDVEFYTPEQLSKRLQIEVRTLQAQARKGQIPGALKIGHQWRFNAARIEGWLNGPPTPTTKLTPSTNDKLARLQQFRRK